MPKVLVAEPSAPVAHALQKFLQGAAEVQVAHAVDEAVLAVRAAAPEVVFAAVSASFDGEALAGRVRQLAPQVATVLVYLPDEDRAPQRAQDAGCDAFLVGPLKKAAVLNALRTVLALSALRERVRSLEGPLAGASPMSATHVNAVDEAFFKKYMLLEVRRSRRYQYPVSLLLIELDGLAARLELDPSPDARRASLRWEALDAISGVCRDIDLAMPFAEDKFLVFLPHTPREGAVLLAERLVVRLRALAAFAQGTASVGIAAFHPSRDAKDKVSFGGLVREAAAHLRAAQAAGGDRVASAGPTERTRRSRISMG